MLATTSITAIVRNNPLFVGAAGQLGAASLCRESVVPQGPYPLHSMAKVVSQPFLTETAYSSNAPLSADYITTYHNAATVAARNPAPRLPQASGTWGVGTQLVYRLPAPCSSLQLTTIPSSSGRSYRLRWYLMRIGVVPDVAIPS